MAAWGAVAAEVESALPGWTLEEEFAREGSILCAAREDWEERTALKLDVGELRAPRSQRLLTRKIDRLNRASLHATYDPHGALRMKSS